MNSSNIRPIHPMRRRQDDYLLPTLSGDARRRTSTKNDLHAPRKRRKETRFSVFLPRPHILNTYTCKPLICSVVFATRGKSVSTIPDSFEVLKIKDLANSAETVSIQ